MIEIPKQELLNSLEEGYKEYKRCKEAGNDSEDLAHIKGFCTTIEQFLAFGGVSVEEMMRIKRPILGDESLRRKPKRKDFSNDDLDVATIFRNRKI